jgi:uncharacterized iron-regulated membrane protein
MKTFRSVVFWMHLVAGLVAGVSIGIMCFTGTLLAFEHEIVEWAERDVRRVAVPGATSPEALAKGDARVPLADLQRKLRESEPDFRAASVVLRNDPTAAVAFVAGRDDARYANPYTGELRKPASTRTHDFMHVMTDWHRYLARAGESRPTGKLINGVCNLAFCFLAVSGLYIWMPRTWSWRGVKAVALLNFKSSGKARDFNWHNTIGLWSAPILIVLTLTAVPISFRWGGNLIYQLVGEEVPAAPGAAPAAPAVEIVRPSPDARPISYDAIVTKVQQDFPKWEQITLRSGGPQRGAGANAPAAAPANRDAAGPTNAEPRRERGPTEGRSAPQPITVIIRENGSWPRTATTTLTLNPFTGDTLSKTGYADLSTARQIRSWTRFLHTGQALGWGGQLVAGLACLGGCFLVYTGFALSWRRFFFKKKSEPEAAAE